MTLTIIGNGRSLLLSDSSRAPQLRAATKQNRGVFALQGRERRVFASGG